MIGPLVRPHIWTPYWRADINAFARNGKKSLAPGEPAARRRDYGKTLRPSFDPGDTRK
jgi:hypothetical protein